MKKYAFVIIAVLVAIVASQSLYVITETEQVVVTEFGKPISTEVDAGIHFKMPWYTTYYFDKRYIRWDGSKSEVPTKDKKFIEVDTTARWRIVDPLKFLESVRDIPGAQSRLDDILDSQVRDVLTSNILIEIVRSDSSNQIVKRIREESARLQEQDVKQEGETGTEDDLLYRIEMGREAIQKKITSSAQETTRREYGIEVIDVRIKRLNYIDDVRQTIYTRMNAERNKVAEKYRSQGRGQQAQILGEMRRRLKEIKSTAERKARQIEGEGDAVAARIYARAYDVDPEFYSFYQTLQSYRSALKSRIRPVFTVDSEYFKYLKDRGQTGLTEQERATRLAEVQATLEDIDRLGDQYSGDVPAEAPKLEERPAPTPSPAPAPSPQPAPTPAPTLDGTF